VDNILVFGNFDIIAYLMAGLAAFIVLDLVAGSGLLFRTTRWNTGSVTAIVLFAYLVGHLISIPSRFFFEKIMAGDCLRSPIMRLIPSLWKGPNSTKVPDPSVAWIDRFVSFHCETIRQSQRQTWHGWTLRVIFGADYFTTAARDVLDRIVAKKPTLPDSRSFFDEAYQAAKHDSIAYERADIFQRLAILFRNMAFLSLTALTVAIGKILFGTRSADHRVIYYGVPHWMLDHRMQTAIFLVLTIGLFNRYLFYYRLFVSEIVIAFAYAPSPISF
jgi:hypothetical protein